MVLALARWLNLLVYIVRHVVIMFRRSWGPSPTRDILYRHKTERVQGDLTRTLSLQEEHIQNFKKNTS